MVEKKDKEKKQKRQRPVKETKADENEFIEKVVSINRVTKVVKGGKNMSFSAAVVVGDGIGKVGFGFGKANEVSSAIAKGVLEARSNMVKVPLKGYTISHEIVGRYGAARVMLKPAGPGTGVIAGAAVRAVCESAGIKDILTKILGTNNPINVIKATLQGLEQIRKTDESKRIATT